MLYRAGGRLDFAARGSGGDRMSMSFPRDGLRVALALLLFVSIGRIHSLLGLEALSPALVFGLVAVGYAALNPSQLNDTALLKTWPARAMAGLALTAFLSVPFGMSMGSSGSYILSVYAKVLLLAYLLIAATRNARDLHVFVWAYVVSCGALIVAGLFMGGGMGRYRSVGMYDANDLSLILLTGIPLALAAYQSSPSTRAKATSLAVLIGGAATIAGGSSRGGFFGLVIVGIALFVLLKRVSAAKRVGLVAVLAATLLVTAPEGYWNRMETTITNPTEDYNWDETYGRRNIWKRGVGYMMSNPITGIGINNFGRAEATYAPVLENINPNQVGSQVKWAAAHNSFVQVGAETGFPGLILFCLLVFGGMISMYRLHQRLPEAWARSDREARFLYYLTRYLPVSFLGFTAAGFFLSYAYLDPIYVLGAFVAGTYASVTSRLRRDRREAGMGRSTGPGRRSTRGTRKARYRLIARSRE